MGPPLAEAEHQRAGASVPGVGVGAQENAARPGRMGAEMSSFAQCGMGRRLHGGPCP